MATLAETFYAGFDWFPCKSKDVRPGDIYANHGSVTASRPARRGEWWGDNGPTADNHEGMWTIECGKSMRCTGDPSSLIVIGRRRRVSP